MAGINSGLLTNATPLSALQEAELEMRAIAEGNAYAYLNADNQICFILHKDPELIKKLAWHNAYQFATEGNTITKTVWQKTGLDSFRYVETQYKVSGSDYWSKIPTEYQETQYLSGSFTSYIDTGVSGNNDDLVIDLAFSIDKYAQYYPIYGNYISETTNVTRLILGAQDGYGYSYTNVLATTPTQVPLVTNDSIIHIRASQSHCIVNDQVFSRHPITKGTLNTGNIALFNRSVNNPTQNMSTDITVKVYHCKMYTGDTLIRDFIPCFRKSDNKPGMYDLVSKEFFTSVGPGEFTYGPVYSNLNEGCLDNFILG